METDWFLQALRRFTFWGGPLRELRSDQGTNFVRSENELKAVLQEMDDEKLKAELLKENIDWIRNPENIINNIFRSYSWDKSGHTRDETSRKETLLY